MSAVFPGNQDEDVSCAHIILLDYCGLSSHGLELREEFTCIHIRRTSVIQGGQHIAGSAPFVSRVAVSVPLGAHLIQVAECRCRGSEEKITIPLKMIVTAGNGRFHWIVINEDRHWGGRLSSLLVCRSLPVAALAVAHLLHSLGVAVFNMGGLLNDLQDNWWGSLMASGTGNPPLTRCTCTKNSWHSCSEDLRNGFGSRMWNGREHDFGAHTQHFNLPAGTEV